MNNGPMFPIHDNNEKTDISATFVDVYSDTVILGIDGEDCSYNKHIHLKVVQITKFDKKYRTSLLTSS